MNRLEHVRGCLLQYFVGKKLDGTIWSHANNVNGEPPVKARNAMLGICLANAIPVTINVRHGTKLQHCAYRSEVLTSIHYSLNLSLDCLVFEAIGELYHWDT